ncbi:hypothetical protein L2E82_10275 [Cichorium intybus]|uniref:Uncharacterized protein n=1 Tax=Cichorium intybus TaxID=13427 RepID=A0ACB9GAQ8_CICIN|nr:hypothetical protein L2E82_10275 [Cichorium intybus]
MAQFYTPILCIRLGPSTHVMIVSCFSCPNLACEFLRKQDEVFCSRPDILSADLISDGYRAIGLSPSGDQWRSMKKLLIQDVLSTRMHKWIQPKQDEEANHLLRYIWNHIQKQDAPTGVGLLNIRIISQHFCGNLIRKMVFGIRFFGKGMEHEGPGEEETEHVASLFTILKYLC